MYLKEYLRRIVGDFKGKYTQVSAQWVWFWFGVMSGRLDDECLSEACI